MSKANEKSATTIHQENAATRPLWRVTYSYTVKHQLRSGTYIIPANNPQEAKDEAHKILSEKFANTESYFKVGNTKPF